MSETTGHGLPGRAAEAAGTPRTATRFAVAGALATLAMTAFMVVAFRRLPRRERYPLPPRLITDRVRRALGLRQLPGPLPGVLTLIAHIGFGGAAAVPLAAYPTRSMLAACGSGVVHGLAVWTAAYLGALPAAGILRPATEHPRGRVALMVGAHVVWGAATGLIEHALRGRQRSRR
ncbi:MAG: hypothetical protein AB7G21_13620 [Dehalococcoidia bacterium]